MGDYREKTNWLPDDPVTEDDINRWEKGIKDAHTDINQHKADHTNPHRTTKNQVGLGNVDNVKQAPKTEFDAHVNNKGNPHGVTKAQVGLGNVPNWNGASQTDARTGTNNSAIMTPLRTKEAIEALASEATIIPAIAGTVSGNDYPLGITTFQHSNLSGYPTNHGSALNIKLSNLRFTQIYVPHARTEADTGVYFRHFYGEEGWTDFWQVETTAGAQAKVNAHANDKGNPHGTTKAQVGLGNVDNVKQAPKTEFDAHVNNKGNPHGVTKAQVGLGNVPNWGEATQAEAQAGTNNAKIMTPLRTKEAFNKFSTDQDTGWITLALHSYLQPQGTSPRVRRIGNTVYLEGTFKNVLDTDVLITVLPDEFRPGRSLTFPTTGQVGHGTVFVTRIDVQSNGRVLFIRSSRQGHGEYEPENWYNLDGIIYTV
ncbi:hypothetical protein MHH67_11175 [Bacillus sp. FSL K6-0047]